MERLTRAERDSGSNHREVVVSRAPNRTLQTTLLLIACAKRTKSSKCNRIINNAESNWRWRAASREYIRDAVPPHTTPLISSTMQQSLFAWSNAMQWHARDKEETARTISVLRFFFLFSFWIFLHSARAIYVVPGGIGGHATTYFPISLFTLFACVVRPGVRVLGQWRTDKRSFRNSNNKMNANSLLLGRNQLNRPRICVWLVERKARNRSQRISIRTETRSKQFLPIK